MTAKSHTSRRELLTGLGGLAAGALLAPARLEAGSLEPPGPPGPTMLPLSDIEPRTIVNEVNTPGNDEAMFVISEPGSYYLVDNITVPSGEIGILVDGDDVTLDLMGRSIQGGPNLIPRIRCGDGGRSNISIRNGGINYSGIDLAHDGGHGSLVEDITVEKNFIPAIHVGPHSRVLSCEILAAFRDGIICGSNSIILDCKMDTGGWLVGIATGDACIVANCILSQRLLMQVGEDCIVLDSTGAINLASGGIAAECFATGGFQEALDVAEESLVCANNIDPASTTQLTLRVQGDCNVIADNRTNGGFGPAVNGAGNLLVRNRLHHAASQPPSLSAGNSWRFLQGHTGAGFSGDAGETPPDAQDVNGSIFYKT